MGLAPDYPARLVCRLQDYPRSGLYRHTATLPTPDSPTPPPWPPGQRQAFAGS